MKRYNILMCLALAVTSCSAQVDIDNSFLIGVWQAKSHEIGSAYGENYQFFKNGKFIFNTSQYNELSRIISIEGSYHVKSDSLYLVAQLLIEDKGSQNLTRSRTTTMNDSWALTGEYKKVEILLQEIDTISVSIVTCTKVNGSPCILIDGNSFYKILNDPSDY